MANSTAHMLPSGDGEKKVNDPKNDPRPFFRNNQTKQLNYQPTFHMKIQQAASHLNEPHITTPSKSKKTEWTEEIVQACLQG